MTWLTAVAIWFAVSLVCGPVVGRFCAMTGDGR
jgi:hypothetical protein